MKQLFSLFFCLTFYHGFSQTINVRAGQDYTKAIPFNERYRYSEFQDGQLHYPQGKRSDPIKLNYNLLFSAVQFIDTSGDTLFISEDSNIFKYVRIGQDLFYHDFRDGYFEMLTRDAGVKLLVQLKWKLIRKDILVDNGYGTTTSVSTADYSAVRANGAHNFVQNENSVFEKDKTYHLLDTKYKIVKANKVNFLKMFSDYKQQILRYLKDNEIDFSKEDDLKRLLEFCNGIENT